MMGHREPLRSGDEYDYLTKQGRRVIRPKAGKFSRVKRAFNRRVRKTARLAAQLAQFRNVVD